MRAAKDSFLKLASLSLALGHWLHSISTIVLLLEIFNSLAEVCLFDFTVDYCQLCDRLSCVG